MLLTSLVGVVVAYLIYLLCLVLYRIYFSPLSRFPGPKLAAASLLYEGYFDLVKDGQYPWKIREMHRKYGPVVRVNPREIHIQDSDYVDHLYLQRLDKDPWFSRSFGISLAAFGTWSHDLHRQRRGAINRFFSKASIASRVDVIQEKVLKLCKKLKPYVNSEQVVQIDAGFIALTLDVIAEFCYGVNYNYLDIPGFDKEFKAMIENVFGSGALNRQVPFILDAMKALPVSWVMRLTPQVAGILRLQEMTRAQARRILASKESAHSAQPSDDTNAAESYFDTESAGVSQKATIFDQILSSKGPGEEKSEERLVQEGQSLIAAGSETTSRVLYLSLVHLLKQPALLASLREELNSVMPDPTALPSLTTLEHLPFLTATIKESIRLSGSTATRTARISPAYHPLQYKDWVFPPGTPVSLTLFDVMMDDTIFPDPERFDPMRWLLTRRTADGQKEVLVPNAALDKYFVAFSRGPRSCVGMWLAWSELYLTMAHVHRKFEMELFETEIEDVAAACDRFSCFAKPGNRGVRVKITGLRTS